MKKSPSNTEERTTVLHVHVYGEQCRMLNMNLLTKKTLSFIELYKAPMPFEDNGLGELFLS